MYRIVVSLVLGMMGTAALADTVIIAREAPLRTVGGPIDGGVWNLWSNGRVGQYLRIARTGTQVDAHGLFLRIQFVHTHDLETAHRVSQPMRPTVSRAARQEAAPGRAKTCQNKRIVTLSN